jgi:hypothetical protein
MNINRNISDSITYPIKDWKKIIILGIILIIPIVNFIGFGYYLRIMKSTLAGSDELPEFESIGELFIDGTKILIVCIIYSIVPLIFYILSFAFPGPSFSIIASIFVIILSIFAYMGIANMANYNGEMRAALRYSEILDRIGAIGWGNYILWWIVLMFIIIFAGGIIGIVGGVLLYFVLGFLVFLVGYGYLVIFHARSIALTFASSRKYNDIDEKAE